MSAPNVRLAGTIYFRTRLVGVANGNPSAFNNEIAGIVNLCPHRPALKVCLTHFISTPREGTPVATSIHTVSGLATRRSRPRTFCAWTAVRHRMPSSLSGVSKTLPTARRPRPTQHGRRSPE